MSGEPKTTALYLEDQKVKEALDQTWDRDDREPPKEVFHLPKTIEVSSLPQQFARVKSAYGFLSAWRRLRNAIWVAMAVPYPKLPEFAARWGKRLYETHERYAYDALCDGDIFFFEAWAGRLALIDEAAQAAGLTLAERGTVLYAYSILKGYADAAQERLTALGGTIRRTRTRRTRRGARRRASRSA